MRGRIVSRRCVDCSRADHCLLQHGTATRTLASHGRVGRVLSGALPLFSMAIQHLTETAAHPTTPAAPRPVPGAKTPDDSH